MVPDKVIYTDGHDVMVTGSVFQVKRDEYRLKGITSHGLQKVRPRRWPGLLLILAGLALGLAGYFRALPSGYFSDLRMYEIILPASTVAIWMGGLLMTAGVLVLGLLKERYAVRIETAEGEKDVVVSTQQEYVQQIINALNKALYLKNSSSMKVA